MCAGLIAGVALAVKTLKPECKVIGVEPKNCRSLEVRGSPCHTPIQELLNMSPYGSAVCDGFSHTCMVLIVCVRLFIEHPIAGEALVLWSYSANSRIPVCSVLFCTYRRR